MNVNEMNKEALIPLVKEFAASIRKQMQEIKDLEDRLKKTDDNLYWYETEYKKLQSEYEIAVSNSKKLDGLTKKFRSTLLVRDELLKTVYDELENLRSKSVPFGGKLEKTLIHISKVTKEKESEIVPLSTPELRQNDNPPKDINNTHNIYKSSKRLLDIIG